MSTIFAADGTSFTPDIVIKEDYIEDVRITDHPIEDGSTVADHAQKLPSRVVVTCMVTETPIAARPVVDGVQSITNAVNRITLFVGQLLSYQSDRLGLIENLMIEGYPYSVDKKRSYVFTISMKQVELATFASVEIPPELPAPEAEAGAPDEVDTGEQPTETPEEEAAEEDKSWLLDGLETIGVL